MVISVLRSLLVVLVALTVVAGAGCGKLKVPGNLSGQILNDAGQGQGYMSVAVVDVATGAEVAKMNAEDGGNFFFSKVEPGTYEIKTFRMSGEEVPNDCGQVTIGNGRTITKTIYLLPEGSAPAEE